MRKDFEQWLPAVFAITVWGVTFASTRALLADFSSLEILVLCFSLAWAGLRMPCAANSNVCRRTVIRHIANRLIDF